MNVYRIPNPFADLADDDCCDLCCAFPVREVIDGDRMCQSCADQWARAEGIAAREEADLLPLSHPIMIEATRKANEALLRTLRMPDAEFDRLAAGQRRYVRQARGGGL